MPGGGLTILVEWNYSAMDHDGFLLQKSTDSGSTWPDNFVLTSVETSYYDTDVYTGGTFWYKVAATNIYGTGSFSNTGSVYVSE